MRHTCVVLSDMLFHPCKLAKGPIPSLAKRKAILKGCNPPVLNSRRRKPSLKQKTETIKKQSTGRSSLSKQARALLPPAAVSEVFGLGRPTTQALNPAPVITLRYWSPNIRSWQCAWKKTYSYSYYSYFSYYSYSYYYSSSSYYYYYYDYYYYYYYYHDYYYHYYYYYYYYYYDYYYAYDYDYDYDYDYYYY